MADSKEVSKVVSLRVPIEMFEAVDRLAGIKYPSRKAEGSPNRSQFILDAIEAYINTSSDDVNNTVDDSVNNVGLTEEEVLTLITAATANLKESIEELSKKADSLAEENQARSSAPDDYYLKSIKEEIRFDLIPEFNELIKVNQDQLKGELLGRIAELEQKLESLVIEEPATISTAEELSVVEEVEEAAPIDDDANFYDSEKKLDAGEIEAQLEDSLATVASGEGDAIAPTTDEIDFTKGLTRKDLAKRLGGKAPNNVTYQHEQGNLAKWSKELDPDGISWEKRGKLYFPVP